MMRTASTTLPDDPAATSIYVGAACRPSADGSAAENEPSKPEPNRSTLTKISSSEPIRPRRQLPDRQQLGALARTHLTGEVGRAQVVGKGERRPGDGEHRGPDGKACDGEAVVGRRCCRGGDGVRNATGPDHVVVQVIDERCVRVDQDGDHEGEQADAADRQCVAEDAEDRTSAAQDEQGTKPDNEDLAHDEDRERIGQRVGELEHAGVLAVGAEYSRKWRETPLAEVVARRREEQRLEGHEGEVRGEADGRVDQPADEDIVAAAAAHYRTRHRIRAEDGQRQQCADQHGEVEVRARVEGQDDAEQERHHDRESRGIQVHQRGVERRCRTDQPRGLAREHIGTAAEIEILYRTCFHLVGHDFSAFR